MEKSRFRFRGLACASALIFVAGGAMAQPSPAPAPAPASGRAAVGSAGEAATARGATAKPTSYSQKPITADVNVTDAMMLNADRRDDWVLHARTFDGQSFTPFTQINAGNVHKLMPSAIIQTGVAQSFENTPIVVNGVMYLGTAFNHVEAFDAVTGEPYWSYTPNLESNMLCCGPQSRGVAVAYNKVYVAQLDGHVVALDAKNGNVVWKTDNAEALPPSPEFYSFTSAPIVYNGMVLVGNAGAEWPTRGFLEALDANTGHLVWRFSTTAAPNEPGGGPDAWAGDSWKFGGGSIWDTPVVDVKNNLVIFATGNPNPDLDGTSRLGNNAYTDSIVALNAKTGKIAWWYQEVAHDVWDYDGNAPVVLFDTKDENGKIVPAAAEANKTGLYYIVNRLTGKLIRKSDAIVPVMKDMFRVPDTTPYVYFPGNKGGAMWSPPSYSPITHQLYTMGVNEAHIFQVKPTPKIYEPGTPIVGQYAGGSMATDLKTFEPSGTFSAVDADTGKITWQYKSEHPMYGGALATASNLVFAGEMNGHFDAFDAKTGKIVWQYNLGMGVCTPPVTYRVKGVQYIAVGASGCHGGEVLMTKIGLPQFGDVMAIFRLPPAK